MYVLSRSLRVDFGPGGAEYVEGGPSDFMHIPKGAIHRESNPADEESRLIVVRAGTGPPTINVDGPET